MTRYLVMLVVFVFALSVCITVSAQESAIKKPAPQAPAIKAPAAQAPVTKGPVTNASATKKAPAVKEAVKGKDYRAVDELKAKGFKTCANTVSQVLKFLHKKDDFAFRNTWNEKSANTHTASVFTVKTYSDGNSYASVNASPSSDGGCDAGFSQIFFFYESCRTMKETSFREWQFHMDLNDVSVYEDPTSKNVVIALVPLANGCLVLKSGTFYFPAKNK